MFAVLTCVHQQHDLRLVLVAALICLMSVVATFAGYRRALKVVDRFRIGWIAFTGLVGGAGVWATHFIAMLAYQPGLTIRYEPIATAVSLLLSVFAVAAGFCIAMSRPHLAGRALGGAFTGLGVGMMHFSGMAAIRTQADLLWRPEYVGASLLIGMVGAAAAFIAAGNLATRRQANTAAGLLMGAICGLHFTAMTAVSLLPNPSATLPVHFIDRSLLAVAVAALAGVIIVAAAALLWIERLTSVATLSSLGGALDGMPSALAFFDSSHRLIFWNERYSDILSVFGLSPKTGLAYEHIVERAVEGGVQSPSAGWRAQWRDVTTAPGSQADNFRLPDGRWLRGEIGATSDGGLVIVLYDITDQIEGARVLAEAKDKAEAANRAKSDFLATMSHEIRTPLNGILGMAQAMQADKPTAVQGEQLRVIRRSGELLLAILNDVLDLAKIEAGKLQLEERDFDMEHLARGSMSPFAPTASKNGVALELEIQDAAKGVFRGDPNRLRQVLNNLISNAVKFTKSGRIVLDVTYLDAELRIRVSDTGVGIPAEHMPTLFEKFTQGDASTTRRFGGSGLGLSICDELMRLMGGSIAVESVEGSGSVFTLRLPAPRIGDVPEKRDGAKTATAPAADAQREVRVLVAEDNDVNQLVLRTLLNQVGVEPVMVGDGAKALDAWRQQDWDVILLDVQMPEMDGPTAARAIRADEQQTGRRRTPIIAVTANAMAQQLADYKAAGMDDVVTKPLEAARLYAALEQALALSDETSVAAA